MKFFAYLTRVLITLCLLTMMDYCQANEEDSLANHYYLLAKGLFENAPNHGKAKELVYLEALKFCQMANGYRPDWGKPKILISEMYYSSGNICRKGTHCSNIQFEVFAAVELMQSAMLKDSLIENEAKSLLNKYNKALPTEQELFMAGLRAGDKRHLACWINKSVTIFRKK